MAGHERLELTLVPLDRHLLGGASARMRSDDIQPLSLYVRFAVLRDVRGTATGFPNWMVVEMGLAEHAASKSDPHCEDGQAVSIALDKDTMMMARRRMHAEGFCSLSGYFRECVVRDLRRAAWDEAAKLRRGDLPSEATVAEVRERLGALAPFWTGDDACDDRDRERVRRLSGSLEIEKLQARLGIAVIPRGTRFWDISVSDE